LKSYSFRIEVVGGFKMKKLWASLKEKFSGPKYEETEQEGGYVELEHGDEDLASGKKVVRTFTINTFEDIKPILDTLREGRTIALINIKPLRDKDLVELKRAINKLKKTTDAIDGEIAGFGDDYLVVCPAFAQIYRSKGVTEVKETAE